MRKPGSSYHGARYYAPWLGRWTAADPAGLVDGPNLYVYARNNAVRLVDPQGTSGDPPAAIKNRLRELDAQRARIKADLTAVEGKIQRASDTAMHLRSEVEARGSGIFSEERKALRSAEAYVKKLVKQQRALNEQLTKVGKNIESQLKDLLSTPGEQGLREYAEGLEIVGEKEAAKEIREQLTEAGLEERFRRLEDDDERFRPFLPGRGPEAKPPAEPPKAKPRLRVDVDEPPKPKVRIEIDNTEGEAEAEAEDEAQEAEKKRRLRNEQESRRLEGIEKPLEKPSWQMELLGIGVLAVGVWLLRGGRGSSPGPGPLGQPAPAL